MMRRTRAVPLLLLVAGCAVVAVAGFFFYRDNFSTHYPLKVISARVFRAGEIPYWNFYDGGGQPLAGNPNTLTFYPDNFLYLILPAHVAFELHFLIHLIAAWFAMKALTRSRPAAWLYVLSGMAISATAFYNLIVAVAAITFAFWPPNGGASCFWAPRSDCWRWPVSRSPSSRRRWPWRFCGRPGACCRRR